MSNVRAGRYIDTGRRMRTLRAQLAAYGGMLQAGLRAEFADVYISLADKKRCRLCSRKRGKREGHTAWAVHLSECWARKVGPVRFFDSAPYPERWPR